jgi:type IV pilus assembly protein PilO
MAILDRIEELPTKQRLLIVGVLLIAMIGGFYQFIYKKKTAKIRSYTTQLTKLNSELQDLRAIQKKLEEFKSMIGELEAQLVEAQRQLPRQKEIPTLLNDISAFGKKAGMEFLSFRPSKEGAKGFYAEVPIKLVINGPFHNLAKFVDEIVHYPRIIKVNTIAMGSPEEEDGNVMLRSTLTATTYRYLEESERASASPQKRKGRRQ